MSVERVEWQHNHTRIETALPTHARLARSRKGTRKRLQKYLQSKTMTKGGLALWDHDSK